MSTKRRRAVQAILRDVTSNNLVSSGVPDYIIYEVLPDNRVRVAYFLMSNPPGVEINDTDPAQRVEAFVTKNRAARPKPIFKKP